MTDETDFTDFDKLTSEMVQAFRQSLKAEAELAVLEIRRQVEETMAAIEKHEHLIAALLGYQAREPYWLQFMTGIHEVIDRHAGHPIAHELEVLMVALLDGIDESRKPLQ